MQNIVANIKIENHDNGVKIKFPLIISDTCNYKQKKCSNKYEQSTCRNCDTIIQNGVNKIHEKYTCQLCTRILIKSQAEAHLKLHEIFVYFSCKYCSFKCFKKEELELHLEEHDHLIHQNNQSLNKKEIIFSRKLISEDKIVFPKDFACHMCTAKYSHKRSLKKHISSDHELRDARKFRCNFCDFKHNKKNCVKWHLINVHKIKDVEGWNKIIKCEESS